MGPILARLDRASVLLSLTMVFWASNMLLARAISGDVPPVALAQIRWTFAAVILLPFAARHLRDDWPVIRRHAKTLLLLGFFGISLYNTLVYIGLQFTTAINATMLSSTFPMMIALVGFILYRDRLSNWQVAGLLISAIGAVIILSRGDVSVITGLVFNRGDLWVILALATYAVYTVMLRERPKIHPLTFLFATIVVGQFLLIPFTVGEAMLGAVFVLDGLTVAVGLYLAIFPAILAYICFNRGVGLIGSNRAAPYFHLVPVFASVGAIALLGERLEVFHVVGWPLILSGIALAQIERRERSRPSEPL
ncbi:MAG: DMT family transporter [Pseudomonadota bacterium]